MTYYYHRIYVLWYILHEHNIHEHTRTHAHSRHKSVSSHQTTISSTLINNHINLIPIFRRHDVYIIIAHRHRSSHRIIRDNRIKSRITIHNHYTTRIRARHIWLYLCIALPISLWGDTLHRSLLMSIDLFTQLLLSYTCIDR